MAAEQIDKSQWAPFFANLTEALIGKQAEIEVVSLDLGDQVEAEWASLIGITYDHKDDLIEIALDELDHMVRSPRQLFIDYGVGSALVAIEIVDGDGSRQIVRFRDPFALPAPSGAAH